MKKLMLGALGSLFVLSACSEGPVATAPEEAPAPPSFPSVIPGSSYSLGLQHHGLGDAMDRFLALVETGAVANGGFETNGGENTNVFPGWSTYNEVPEGSPDFAGGSFFAQTGDTDPSELYSVPVPPEGDWSAMSAQTWQSLNIIYQEVVVPSDPSELHFQLFIGNRAEAFHSPSTLDPGSTEANQQFRMDIMEATWNPLVWDPAQAEEGVLDNVYQTQPGDPLVSGYTEVVHDLSAFAGETVLIRFAVVAGTGIFNAGLDDVVIVLIENDPATRDECMMGAWEAFGFKNQGQCVRFVETGKDSR